MNDETPAPSNPKRPNIYRHRIEIMPESIRKLALIDPEVNLILEAYATEQIETPEATLIRMVEVLAQTKQRLMNELISKA